MHQKSELLKECHDLRTCAYFNWCEQFSKITIKFDIIPIQKEVVEYLKDEIIILPKECYEFTEEIEDEGDDALNTPQPEFPEFSKMIAEKIKQLGGSVFIKTNWHSPKDAFWITAGQTMCCKDIIDVYQLLKASGICKEDLACHNRPVFNEVENGASTSIDTNQYLTMKKWYDIHPGTEFRCFVQNKRIIGISPRDWPQYHEHICLQKIDIVNDIVSMFKEQIKHRFPLNDYVFDVVRDSKDHVYLLDFSPFGEKWTEFLAFEGTDFSKLDISEGEEDPEFRYLSSDCGIQPSKRNNYGVPKDIIDMFRGSSNSNIDDTSESASSTQAANTLDDFINNRLETIFRSELDVNEQENPS